MFKFFARLLSNRRLDKIYADERFAEQMPSLRIDWSEDIHLDLDRDGQRIAYHTPSMKQIDINTVKVKSGQEGNWADRSKPRYQHQYDVVEQVANFLQMRNVDLWCGVPFCKIDGRVHYVARDSVRPLYVVLYTETGKEYRIPKALFGYFRDEDLLRPDIYTMHPVDLHTHKPVEDWKPIIQMVPGKQDIHGAYTYLNEVAGCPGILDFQSQDIIININILDNSATPIVDLKPFLWAIRDGVKHESKRWTLSIDQIQLQIGMNPKPIKVLDLSHELPEHRIILSDVPTLWSVETYINTGNLPTTYP
jgi:hypothetical protein